MADEGWQRKFDDPVTLNGRMLITLRHAAYYITALPKEESGLAKWQVSIEALMLVSRSGSYAASQDRGHASAEQERRSGV
jgi:hypothetical protein